MQQFSLSLYQVVIYCPFLTVCCFSLSLYCNTRSCHITAGDSRNSFSDTLFWGLIDCTKFLASSSEMQKETILHTNAVREKQTEAKSNRDSERERDRERERDWVREALSLGPFTVQLGPNPHSVQLRLGAGWSIYICELDQTWISCSMSSSLQMRHLSATLPDHRFVFQTPDDAQWNISCT